MLQYNQFLHNTSKTWLLADGGGETKLCPTCARQRGNDPITFELDPGGAPYMDAYWYLQLGPQSIQRDIWYDLTVKFPTAADFSHCQGVEDETDRIANQWHFDTGIQADFSRGIWRTFDLPTEKWVNSKYALPTQQNWLNGVNVVSICSVVAPNLLGFGGGIRYEGLLVDGTWLPLGIFSKAVKVPGKPDHCNMAFQADGNEAGLSYSVEVSMADLRTL